MYIKIMFYIILFFIFFYNYILPYIIVKFNDDQNLKLKYSNCKWAIVTGGSSGIGKSICERLLSQGISIIIASKDESEFIKELKLKYNNNNSNRNRNINQVKIKSIELDFTKKESCKKLIEFIENDSEIEKESLKLLFCNAGYLTIEGYHQTEFNDKLDMLQCNSLTSVELSDYFYKHLIQINNSISNGRNGAIIFTSSYSGVCPTPYSTIYASSKAFLTCLAKQLSIESDYFGIDILVVQPGLINTNIFSNVKDHSLYKILRLVNQEPSQVVDIMFRGLGNKFGIIIFNSGLFSEISNILISILGMNIVLNIIKFLSKYILKDFSCYRILTNNIIKKKK